MKDKKTLTLLIIGISTLFVTVIGATFAFFVGSVFNTNNKTELSGVLAGAMNISLYTIGDEINIDVPSESMLAAYSNYYPVADDGGTLLVSLTGGTPDSPVTCDYDLYYEYIIDDTTTDYTVTNPNKLEFTYEIDKGRESVFYETNFIATTNVPQKLNRTFTIRSDGEESIDNYYIHVNFYNLDEDQSQNANANWKIKFYIDTNIERCYVINNLADLAPGIYDWDLTLIKSYSELENEGFDVSQDQERIYYYDRWEDRWYVINDLESEDEEISADEVPDGIPAKVLANEEYQDRFLLVLPEGTTKIGTGSLAVSDFRYVGIPSSVTEIGDYAFAAAGLDEVLFRKNSSLATIGENAFIYNDVKLISIPSGVLSIGSNAFGNENRSIAMLNYDGTAEDTDNNNWGARFRNPYIENDFAYADSTKETLITYLGYDSNLTIPASVVNIYDEAFIDRNYESITFEEGSNLQTIGKDAFKWTDLNSLTIPDSVTSIGEDAFYNVFNINYNGNATDQNNDNWGAKYRNAYFEGDFIYLNSNKTDIIGYNGAYNSDVVIPSSIISIGDRVFQYKRLRSLTIEEGSQLTSIGEYAFSYTYLESITIPNTVISIGVYAFSGIENLFYRGTAADTYNNNWGARNRNIIADAVTLYYSDSAQTVVSSCRTNGKTKVVIPAQVKTINSWVFYNKGITEVVFEEGSQLETIGTNAFSKNSISTLTLPNSITTIEGSAFEYNNLKELIIPDSVTTIGGSAFGYNNIKIATVSENTTSISPFAFNGTIFLSYNGPAQDSYNSLWGAGYLNVDTSNLYTENDYVYLDSSKEFLVTYEGNDSTINVIPSVREIANNAFFSNSTIMYATFASYGNLEKIGKSSFRETSIRFIDVPSSVTEIGEAAFSGIRAIHYEGPASVSNIGVYIRNPYIEDNLAYLDESKEILRAYIGFDSTTEIPKSVRTISDSAFIESNIEYITIPNSVEIIGYDAFKNSKNLETVIFEEGSNLYYMRGWVFSGTAIENITIPSSVTRIEQGTFNGANNLQNAYFEDPYGWVESISEISQTLEEVRDISPSTLSDPQSAADFLRNQKTTGHHDARKTNQGVFTFYDWFYTIEPYAFANASYITGIIFPESYKWQVGDIILTYEDLRDPEVAATLVKETYADKQWTRYFG